MSDRSLAATFKAQVERVSRVLAQRPSLSAITVEYGEAIANPEQFASRINAFVGGGLDEKAMASVVDRSMVHETQ